MGTFQIEMYPLHNLCFYLTLHLGFKNIEKH